MLHADCEIKVQGWKPSKGLSNLVIEWRQRHGTVKTHSTSDLPQCGQSAERENNHASLEFISRAPLKYPPPHTVL
jgi:hypothetical protein